MIDETPQALLLLSFGGPEGPDEVRPFLENVTRGRGVPPERLDEVAQHYHHFGGVSPINALNRDLIDRIQAELAERDLGMPIYFGNRNWHPMVEDALQRMSADGIDSALVLATSAYGGYSACRQYDEDIARARAHLGKHAPQLTKLRQFFDHPEFVAANTDAVRDALLQVGEQARLVFTAHSIPDAADQRSGPPDSGGRRYSRQVAEAARLVAGQLGRNDWDLVWQSRSGPPTVPWLEPDIVDHIDTLHAADIPGLVICPIGFVSDHLEVVWDLDNEAAARAQQRGLAFARAATAGTDPRFPRMVAELICEQLEHGRAPRKLSGMPIAGSTSNGQPCVPGCCGAPAPTPTPTQTR